MTDLCEWHEYHPTDLNTHPEDNTNVEMEYADGRSFSGVYSRALGILIMVGDTYFIPEETVKLKSRWRYIVKN